MKKLMVCLVVLAFLLVPAMAMAETPSPRTYNSGIGLPDGAVEVEHWELVSGAWVHHGTDYEGARTALARCWKSGEELQHFCNKESHSMTFTNHASMAQWCDVLVTESRYDWRILKPGTYAADCITIKLKSNNDVLLTFKGFGDLQYQETGYGVKQTIDTYYAVAQSIPLPDSTAWKTATSLNGEKLMLDSWTLHNGYNLKLYNKLVVENCNSSCEYENVGTVDVKLMNIKNWVDASENGYLNGFWKELPQRSTSGE